MDQLTKNRQKDNIRIPACPICDGQSADALFSYTYPAETSHIVQCHNCGHLRLYPVPLTDLASRNMDSESDAELFGSPLLQFLQRKLIIQREIGQARKLLKNSSARLLDIGCGTGWTTAIWKENGFQVTGLEPSDARRKICQERRVIEVFGNHIENFVPTEKFDIVILRHVFEHIENPEAVLARIRERLLKEGGLLLLILPNINCIGRYIFQNNWTWVLPWHLHFYNPKNLSRLLAKTGFKNLNIYQTPSPLWYPDSLGKFLGPNTILGRAITGPLRYTTMLFLSPLILIGMLLNLNDNMTVFAQNTQDGGKRS